MKDKKYLTMRKCFLTVATAITCSLFQPEAKAQITVTPSVSAGFLANKLVGPGVVIISPTLTCPTGASGSFTGTSVLSFGNGIVLSTGQAATTTDTVGVNSTAFDFASTGYGAPGDAQLSVLAGQTTFDGCVLEFDFRPVGDSIKFNYVFGSEEYTDFTCSPYNDVFGFLISGPGYATPTNIAVVPGTNIPVCINSVNCGATGGYPLDTCLALGPGTPFCIYYVDNSAGSDITFDGLTTTLTAKAAVTPCDTYHLKIGIADAADDILDSGVFLESGSLTSTGVASIEALGINPTDTAYGTQFAVRNCFPGRFIINREGNLGTSSVVHFAIAGSAINGYDYTTIADSLVFPPSVSTDTITINSLPVTPAGPKTVKIYIQSTFLCNGVPFIIDSAELTIYDSLFVHINTPDTNICPGQSVVIYTSGATPLRYSWSPSATLNNDTLLSPTATPTEVTTYTVTAVYPGSGCRPSTDQVTISFDTTSIRIFPSDTTICIDQPVPIKVILSPADSPYSFVWSDPTAGLSDPAQLEPSFFMPLSGTYKYYLTFTNSRGCVSTDSTIFRTLPGLDISASPTVAEIKYGESVQLNAISTSESPALYYYWTPNDGTLTNANINNPVASPTASTTYIVYARNEWCLDSALIRINVDSTTNEFIPSAFTPNGDGRNDIFRLNGITHQRLVSFGVYNRWGQQVYQNNYDTSNGWDGTHNGVPQDMGVYHYLIIVARPDGENITYKGDVTLVR